MNTSAEVLNIALQLPQSERALVAHELLLSLEDEPFDDDVDAAWQVEIERRMGTVESGNYSATDVTEVIAQVRQSLKKQIPS
jgi:putative addiction module component (TIGR02574 family)